MTEDELAGHLLNAPKRKATYIQADRELYMARRALVAWAQPIIYAKLGYYPSLGFSSLYNDTLTVYVNNPCRCESGGCNNEFYSIDLTTGNLYLEDEEEPLEYLDK